MERGQFTFYASYYRALRDLKAQDRLRLYDAIAAYGIEGIEPNLTGLSKTVFELVKPTLDAGAARAGNARGKGSRQNQKKSNEIKSEQNRQSKKQNRQEGEGEKEREEETEKEVEKEEETEIEDDCQRERDTAAQSLSGESPTLGEALDYAETLSILPDFDVRAWWKKFDSRGWTAGSGRITDWRLFLRACAASASASASEKTGAGGQSAQQEEDEIAKMRRFIASMEGGGNGEREDRKSEA